MVKKIPTYLTGVLVIVLTLTGLLSAGTLAGKTTDTLQPGDHNERTSLGELERHSPVLAAYDVQLHNAINVEVSTIEDEDEDELGHTDKQYAAKKYIDLSLFFCPLVNSPLKIEQPGSNQTHLSFTSQSLNITFCVFRI